MKKIFFVFACVFILTACSKNNENENLQNYELITALDDYGDLAILYNAGNKIYFNKIHADSENGNSVFTLYEYDLSDNEVKLINEIDDFFLSTNSVVPVNEGFAFTVCTQKTEGLINNLYYYREGILQKLYSWKSNIPMSYVEKVSDEELIIFYPDSITKGDEDFYLYEIRRVRLDREGSVRVKGFHFNITQQEGEIVPAIDLADNLIYLFKKTVQDTRNEYYICSFDLDGNKVEEYVVDMDEFLYLDLTSSFDSVYRIECLKENLFVLQTLNNRIIIFEKVGDKLVQADIPERLYAYPEGYKIAQSYNEQGSEIFFANMFNDNLIKFDVYSKKFLEMNIVKFSEEFYVSSININLSGDILLQADGHFYLYQDENFQFLKTYSLLEQNAATEIISPPEENVSEMEKEELSQQPEEQPSPQPDAQPSSSPDSEIPTESTESYVRIPYEVESITESYYEKNGSYIEFNDLPENDAETIACLRLLYSITGKSWTECGYEYYYVPEESSECREEIEEESWESICEWIKVEQVETMSLDSLAECDPRQELFAILKRQLYAGGTYEDYVQMLLDNGCVVVCVEYTDQYKAGYETVQVGDGAHETHWLFVPDENGQLRVFDYTGIFGQFNMSPGAKVPEVLKWSVK